MDDVSTNSFMKYFLESESFQSSQGFDLAMYTILTNLSYCFLLIHPIHLSILFSDESAQNLFQYSNEEFLSIPFYRLNETPWEKVTRLFSFSQNQKRKHTYATLKKKDGSSFYAELFLGSLPMKGETCNFAFIKNLSEIRNKEEHVVQNEKRYKTLFSNMNFPLACLEVQMGENREIKSCNLMEFNPAFENMVSMERKNLEKRPILEVIPSFGQLPSPWIEYVNHIMLDHEPVNFEVNIGLQQKNYFVTGNSLNDTQFSIIFEDITSQKRLDKLRNAFINTLTHEIRTPLTAIKAGMEIWTKNPDSPLVKQENLPNMIQNNVNRLIHLINEVLDYQKIDNQTFQDFFTLQSINQLIQEIVINFQNTMEEKNIKLQLDLDDSIQKSWFYRDKISQVLIQLINNALKLTNYGQISISSLLKRNMIQITVSDTGVGIDQDSQKKLFDTFFQINPSSRDDSGLGLAMSRKIVERHGGTIWVESKPFQGSSFYFTLPYDILSKNQKGTYKK